MEEFRILVTSERDMTVVTVVGDLDLHTKNRFLVEVLPLVPSVSRLVLDFSRVGFLDSTGIGALTGIRQALKERGLPLHVVASRRARAALQLAGLTSALTMHDTLAAARSAHPSER